MHGPRKSPEKALLAGVDILSATLGPHGFEFELRGVGKGSGGHFAWGEFVRDDRRLELHYRESLGLVTYHASGRAATHEAYMRELGVWGRNRYPGYSSDHLQAFRDLAHDLAFAEDFLSGDADCLLSASDK